MKRKFGKSIKALKYWLLIKEIKVKVILYNLSKLMISFAVLIVVEEFYRAVFHDLQKHERDHYISQIRSSRNWPLLHSCTSR